MEYRIMGKTGLKVSVVGMGTIPLNGPLERGVISPEEGRREIAKTLNRALDLGINLIDTSYIYGKGHVEEGVGDVMKTRKKEAVVISRTCLHKSYLGNPVSEHIRLTEEAVNTSLKRLQSDYIDVYQVHDIGSEEEYEQVWKTGVYEVLKEARRAGKVRFIGVSCHCSAAVIKRMIEEEPDIDVITVPYNACHQKKGPNAADMKELLDIALPTARKHNVGVTVMKPLAGGVLTWTPADGKKLSPAKLLRYVIQNPYVHSVTPGIRDIDELEEDIRAGDRNFVLSEEDMRELERETMKWGPDICRQCGYCLPCPQDVDIPRILAIRQRWKYRKDSTASTRYRGMQVGGDACVECGQCEEKCPYDLPVAGLIKEMENEFGCK